MEQKIEELAQDISQAFSEVQAGCRLTDCDLCVYNNKEQCKAYAIAERLDLLDYRKQVQGEWIVQWCDNNLLGHEVAECSNCSCMYLDTEKTFKSKYCPNCGAKMKGAE